MARKRQRARSFEKEYEGSSFLQSLASATVKRASRVVSRPPGAKGERWTERHEKEFLAIPVETLIDDPYFLGLRWDPVKKSGLYPCHRDDIIQIWNARKKHHVNYVVDVEGIGSGKTTKFAVILWLLVYELVCKMSPQRYYHLDPRQDIALICMSRNALLARRVTFRKVLPYFNSPFFRDYFPPTNVDIETVLDEKRFPQYLRFPKNVVVFPGTSSEATSLGFDVIGGALDEANYCQVIEDSRKSRRADDRVFDAAETVYHSIADRMTSRFGADVPPDYFFYMCSNVNFPGDFCERRIQEVVLRGTRATRTMVFRRSLWEAKPWAFSKERVYFDTDTLKFVSKKRYDDQFKKRRRLEE